MKVILARFFCKDSSQQPHPTSGVKNVFLFQIQVRHMSHGKCMPCFQVEGERTEKLPASAVFQLLSAQNNIQSGISEVVYSVKGAGVPGQQHSPGMVSNS